MMTCRPESALPADFGTADGFVAGAVVGLAAGAVVG
jgi:hypothetical protein